VYAENKEKLSTSGSSISETKAKFSLEPAPSIKDQDFYKATVQAYKDFNEQVVKYISVALTIVSVLATGLVVLFIFFFRKTLADIRKDLKEDSESVQNIYSKTFELLNEQAKANLAIFKSREEELRASIKDGQDLYTKLRTIVTEISNNQKIRETVAQELGVEEVERMEDTRKKTEAEFKEIKKGLTEEKEKYDE
jgi:hypothetical protein